MSKNFFKTKKIQIIKNPKGNLYKMLSKKHNFFSKNLERYIFLKFIQKNSKVGSIIKKELK